MKKALVAGHICLDVTLKFSETSQNSLNNILEPGKLFVIGPADLHTGGAVANTGLAMHFFGADVELLAKVGNDGFGKIVIQTIEQYGAKNKIKIDSGDNTSYSIVIARPNVDRTFLHYPGNNDTFIGADITESDIEDKTLIHFGYPTLMSKMYKNDGKEITKLFKRFKDRGKITSLDLSSVDPISEAGKADWHGILKRTLPYVDFFLPSFEELCFMLDRKKYNSLVGKHDMCTVISVSDIKELAHKALELGAAFTLIKAGAAGMFYTCTKNTGFINALELNNCEWLGREGFEKSFLPEKICSGTGAGDTAVAAFLTSLLNGFSVEKCVSLAAASGASCVEAYDALSGLKPLKELEKKIALGWPKQNLIKED